MTLPNGETYRYEKNAQGDITGLLDSGGSEVVTYTYGSWGNLLSIGGSLQDTVGVKNPFRYRGYYYDTETGLYYLQSRYYSPGIGRFISKDDVSYHQDETGAAANLYAYANDNPIMNIDFDGHRSFPRWIFSAAIDLGLWIVLGTVNASWRVLTQPIKAFGKKMAQDWFKRTFIPTFSYKFLNPITSAIRWIILRAVGISISTTFSSSVTMFLKQVVSNNIDMILSLGGLISGILDWVSDHRLDGKVTIPFKYA